MLAFLFKWYIIRIEEVFRLAKKFTATFDEKLLKRVDFTAEEMGLTRSAFLAVAVNTYFQQFDALKTMNEMTAVLSKLEELEIKIDESKA